MSFTVQSEIGRLRQVIVHRPASSTSCCPSRSSCGRRRVAPAAGAPPAGAPPRSGTLHPGDHFLTAAFTATVAAARLTTDETVTLDGQVVGEDIRDAAVRVASEVDGVALVIDKLSAAVTQD